MIAVERWGAEGQDPARHGGPGVWFVHGILGQGRNWRSFARRLVAERPEVHAVLPDLRGHGGSLGAPGPHTLDACVSDLEALAAVHGRPAVVVGHSFGGKVALRWAQRPDAAGRITVVLDAPPSPLPSRVPRGPTDPLHVLPALRAVSGPVPARDALRAPLVAAGVPEVVVAWLLTSARRSADGWRWGWELDVVDALLDDYFAADLCPALERGGFRAILVRAGRSDRWSDRDLTAPLGPGVTRELLPDAGHWVHVDDPDGTFTIVTAALDEALRGPVARL